MSTSSFAEEMVERLQQKVLANAGSSEVVIDGTRVRYEDLKRELAYWERKLLRERRGSVGRININAW